jgi:hypothetical protein
MISKIVVGVLCMINLVIFVCDPSENMINGMVCGMLFADLLWLTVCD